MTEHPNPFASSASVELDIDRAIEDALEGLAEHGSVEDLQQLHHWIPEAEESIQRFVLIELIKLDMAMAAEDGPIRRVENYVRAMPNLLSTERVPLDLVLEERQLRKEAGECPSNQEYVERFPQLESKLGHLSDDREATLSSIPLGVPPELPLGSSIDDFLIILKLGDGAFAHVYLARQESMSRLVALKVSRGKGDEPRALAQFDHSNIVHVFDQRNLTKQQLHLLYMKYHPGGTLADTVKLVRMNQKEGAPQEDHSQCLLESIDRNLLHAAQVVPDRSAIRTWISDTPWPVVVAWLGIQLARALEEAHSRGVFHRDVKPANVLLTAEGIPQLADFNVSFAGAAGRAGAAACFGGSIGYMAPEHLRALSAEQNGSSSDVKARADLFSLSVLLWELWQGQRPFQNTGPTMSWSDAVNGQLKSRDLPLVAPRPMVSCHTGDASERVLENVLRRTLTPDPERRAASGSELAGQLRLALHPDAATLFDPNDRSFAAWIHRLSPWWIAILLILVPNIAAGIFNYLYNQIEVGLTPEMQNGLRRTSVVVNSIAFPIGIGFLIWYVRVLTRALRSAKEKLPVTPSDLDGAVDLGHRAAVIGGACWIVAGVIYPVVLSWTFPDFSARQSLHFFLSLLICGGVAMIYPFFGLAFVTSIAYYPRLVKSGMQDANFDRRVLRLVSQSEVYLLIAAIIPMLATALLVSGENPSKSFMWSAIGAGLVGLLASFFVYRMVVRIWKQLATVLSSGTSMIPGDADR